MDFYKITEKVATSGENMGMNIVSPSLIVGKSSDLMVRGKGFYAIWNEEKGLWDTDEYSVPQLIDEELNNYVKTHALGSQFTVVQSLRSFNSGSWREFKNYMTLLPDNYVQLDEQITFANTEVKKSDFVSRRLPYSLEPGKAEAYDEILATAQDVLTRAQAGEDFDALLEEYGQDTGMKNEPNKSRGYLVCECLSIYEQSFQDAAMALAKVGDVSAELVKTSYGYHILQYATDVTPGAVELTEEIKSDIYNTLLSDAKDAAYESAVTQWVSEAKVTTYPKVMK